VFRKKSSRDYCLINLELSLPLLKLTFGDPSKFPLDYTTLKDYLYLA
jgi:hypothetical protein